MLKWYITDMFLYSVGIFSAVQIYTLNIKRKNNWKLLSIILLFIVSVTNITLGYIAVYLDKSFGFLLGFSLPILYTTYFLILTSEINLKSAYFYVFSGFILYFFVSTITRIGNFLASKYYIFELVFNWYNVNFYIISVILMAIIYFIVYKLLIVKFKSEEPVLITKSMIFIWILISILLNLISFIQIYIPDNLKIIFNMFILVICILLEALHYIFYQQSILLIKEVKMQNSLETMDLLWRLDNKETILQQELINQINLKCHDLKQYNAALKAAGIISSINTNQMEDLVKKYDSKIKTGNRALDIILTDKSFSCTNLNIQLSCIVDGKQLEFLPDNELYIIFGNAIDNAIEYLYYIEDLKKRFIFLRVFKKKNFIFIEIENYFKDSIINNNYFPTTTKEDRINHGYGLLSIKTVVESNKGIFKICVKNNIFTLRIIFPV